MEITGLARRLAEDNDVDWRQLTGTGEGGRITEQDVIDHLARELRRSGPVDLESTSPASDQDDEMAFDESIFALEEDEEPQVGGDVAPSAPSEPEQESETFGAVQETTPRVADSWDDGSSDWLATPEDERDANEFDWLDAELSIPEPVTTDPAPSREV